MRQRPIKLTSIAGTEPAEKTMQSRVIDATANNSENPRNISSKQATRKIATQKKKPVQAEKPKDGEPFKISAVVQVCEKLERRAQKQAQSASIEISYAKKYLAKQSVARFRELDLTGDEKGRKKAASRLTANIARFFEHKQQRKTVWHRARIVLSEEELETVHELCNDPLGVKTGAACVNAVLYALLWELSVPRTDHAQLDIR